MKVDSEDHFLGERKAKKEEMQALVVAGVEVPPNAKKPRVEGSSRLGCALNNHLSLEKQNRTGMCNFYRDYLGRKQGVVHVKAPIKCAMCDVGQHEECYNAYHQMREGVILNLAFEINQVQLTHKSLRKWPRKTLAYAH